MRHLLIISVSLILLTLLSGFLSRLIVPDCNESDSLFRSDVGLVDPQGFGNDVPVGFMREGYSMQGAASAVEWYGDYIYLAAASVLQVYHAPPGASPDLIREIELRDWVREMDIAGNTLFVAARGDGLYAFDLVDPAHPEPAGRVSGLFDAGDYTSIEAVFNGVYAQDGRVAVALANNVPKNQGGVDAIVFDYNATTDSFTPVRVIGTEVRSRITSEVPITVALTEDAYGLYIGYSGELVYLPLDDPLAPILTRDLGTVMDIATKGDTAFVAVTDLDWPWVEVSMLS